MKTFIAPNLSIQHSPEYWKNELQISMIIAEFGDDILQKNRLSPGMKQNDEPREHPQGALIWMLSATAGLVVANNYYNQPLLPEIASEFSISDSAADWISSLTQFGYAFGLLLLLPLGDRIERRNLISIMLLLSSAALTFFSLAKSYYFAASAAFLIGFTSIVPQMLPPMVSQLVGKANSTAAVGKVMAGLLLGIVLSRFAGGWGGQYLGWRHVYLTAAAVMIGLLVVLKIMLPAMPPTFSGSYTGLMSSLMGLWKKHKILRQLAMSAALQFGAFSMFWGTVGFHLYAMPQKYPPSTTGSLALIGAGGVVGALAINRLSERFSPRAILLGSGGLMALSFCGFALATNSLVGTIPAVVLLDMGMQINHVRSMSSVLNLDRSASSRLNTIYMVVRFLGAAIGTLLGGWCWQYGGWLSVCAMGVVMCSMGVWINMKHYE